MATNGAKIKSPSHGRTRRSAHTHTHTDREEKQQKKNDTKWKNKCERTHMERRRCRCRCRWMPLSGRAWSGLVSGHMEDMPFSGVLYVTVPHLWLAGFVGRRHRHIYFTVSLTVVRATSKTQKPKKPLLTAPLLMVFEVLVCKFARLVIFISICALRFVISHENVLKYLRVFMWLLFYQFVYSMIMLN